MATVCSPRKWDPAVVHEEQLGNARGRCVVRRAEVCDEDVAVGEALAVEVADVPHAVDGRRAGDEVTMAPAEVVHALAPLRPPASLLRARGMFRRYGSAAPVTSSPLTLRVQSSRRARSDRTSRSAAVA